MASVREMARHIGRKGTATMGVGGGSTGTIEVPVEVLDARERYGNVDLLVTPIGGSGELWLTEAKVTFADQPAELTDPEGVENGDA